MAEPSLDLQPNRHDMQAHLSLLFGHAREYDDGLIEIAINTNKGWRGQLFTLDAIPAAVAYAAEMNQAGCNAYVGVALRDPDTPLFGRASDADHYATTVIGGDLDTAAASAAAGDRTRHLPPSFVVCTGQHPHTRLQPFWQLEEAITDAEQHRQLFGGIADMLDGDRVITNPGRIMRLAGSIAWPTKQGRVPELTYLVPLKYQPKTYSAEAIAKAYPAQAGKVHSLDATHKNDPIERVGARNSLGLETGKIEDGREDYLRRTLYAVLMEYVGTHGAAPSEQELFDLVWPQYERGAVTQGAGLKPRGQAEVAAKCRSTLRRFEQRGLTDGHGKRLGLAEMVAAYAEKKAKATPKPNLMPQSLGLNNAGSRFQWITHTSAASPVLNGNWLVKRVVPAEGIGVIFGRPGSGKTFSVMDLAMHVAAGIKWRNLKVTQAAVAYVSPEAGRLGVNRVIGWTRHHGTGWPEAFRLSPVAIDLCSSTNDAEALVADIKANQPNCRLVVIDTLNRAMAGGDENDGQDMGKFVAICDLVAKALQAFVLIVHHSGKDVAKGSRGHSSLLGAVSLELEVTKEQGEPGTIKVTKMRDGEDGAEYGFQIDSVPLGVDEDGEEVTTGISLPADIEEVRVIKAAKPTGKVQVLVANAFEQFALDNGRPNPAGTGFAEQGRVTVVDSDNFVEFAAGKLVGPKPHEKRKSIRDAIDGLVAKGFFAVNRGCMWRLN